MQQGRQDHLIQLLIQFRFLFRSVPIVFINIIIFTEEYVGTVTDNEFRELAVAEVSIQSL